MALGVVEQAVLIEQGVLVGVLDDFDQEVDFILGDAVLQQIAYLLIRNAYIVLSIA